MVMDEAGFLRRTRKKRRCEGKMLLGREKEIIEFIAKPEVLNN